MGNDKKNIKNLNLIWIYKCFSGKKFKFQIIQTFLFRNNFFLNIYLLCDKINYI